MRIIKVIKRMIFIIFLLIAFVLLGRAFLVVDESPKKSDVIIVLSGDTGRLEKAAILYKEGYAENVMLSVVSESSELNVGKAVDLGILEDRLMLEEKATSTYTNALYTKTEMKKHNFTSAIVVSSDYHMRRTKLTFDRVYKDTDIEITYVASQKNGQLWYKEKGSLKITVSEFIKTIGYMFGMYKYIDHEEEASVD